MISKEDKKSLLEMSLDLLLETLSDVKSYEEYRELVRVLPTWTLEKLEAVALHREEYMLVAYTKKELQYRSTLPKPNKDILNRRR